MTTIAEQLRISLKRTALNTLYTKETFIKQQFNDGLISEDEYKYDLYDVHSDIIQLLNVKEA
jgi:hypothetical protein